MKAIYRLFALVILSTLFTGCASVSGMFSDEEKVAPVAPPKTRLERTYPVREELSVMVTFESGKAYDDVQMGLYILDKMLDDEKVPSIDEPNFFPKYFTMVNRDINDGMLYIDEAEGEHFSKVIYLEYQKRVLAPYLKKKMNGGRVLKSSAPPANTPVAPAK